MEGLISAITVFIDYLGVSMKKSGEERHQEEYVAFSRMVSPMEMSCFTKRSHNQNKIFFRSSDYHLNVYQSSKIQLIKSVIFEKLLALSFSIVMSLLAISCIVNQRRLFMLPY